MAEFEPGDLVRVIELHLALPVDGATIRISGPGSTEDRILGHYLMSHPQYTTREIRMDTRFIEKV